MPLRNVILRVMLWFLGLAKNMDNSEGTQAKLCRTFGQALGLASGKRVHYFDERLSSRAADELLRPADLTRKKKKGVRDSVAAQIILQGFLDAQSNHASS
jgi:putative Holliday junction resolvase